MFTTKNRFSVRAGRPSPQRYLRVIPPVLATLCVVEQPLDPETWLQIVAPIFFIFFLVLHFSPIDKEVLEKTVSITPIGVQLSTSRNRQIQPGKKRFFSREDIVDMVVTEVILSHKVVSVLMFRLAKEARSGRSVQELMDAGKIELQVAFPGVEMKYKQCMDMRTEIIERLKHF
mmetsp:Transcript_41888/g.58889  ORF Transcript_41888/g.58889 Transcript_41888/m.58889 type:complete len:174 (+) Transcript_41888:19-540(+)